MNKTSRERPYLGPGSPFQAFSKTCRDQIRKGRSWEEIHQALGLVEAMVEMELLDEEEADG